MAGGKWKTVERGPGYFYKAHRCSEGTGPAAYRAATFLEVESWSQGQGASAEWMNTTEALLLYKLNFIPNKQNSSSLLCKNDNGGIYGDLSYRLPSLFKNREKLLSYDHYLLQIRIQQIYSLC